MAKDLDPTTAAPMDAAKAVGEAPSSTAIEALANSVADKVASKSVSATEVKEMFTEYMAQQSENARKAVEGKPEEASKPDAGNMYQAKSAFEWMKEAGFMAEPKSRDAEITPLGALSRGLAYGALTKDLFRGFDRGMKEKAFGGHGEFVSKALGIDDFTAGGALSTPEMAAELVPALLSETAVFGDPGIQVVPVNGQMEFAYENTSATERWTAENAAANASEPAFDQVTLRPEAVSIIVPVSKKMLKSVSFAASAIEQSIRRRFAERVDNKLIRGDGTTNIPMGLRFLAASANVLNVNGTVSAANTDEDLGRMFQAIQAADVPFQISDLRFAFSPRTFRYLSQLRGTDVYLFKQELMAGRLLGVKVAGSSGRGISNIPENLAVTGSSESEIYLYNTAGLRLGISEDMTIMSSDTAAYNDSSGTVQSALSRNQQVYALHSGVGLVDVYRGLGIAVLSDVDWT